MHRVLSFQMNHQDEDQPAETISKRLCCSVLFTTAFLSIVGGYLLGRYATERAILIKQLNIDNENHHRSDLIDIFLKSADVLESKQFNQSLINSDALYNILLCNKMNKFPNITEFKLNIARNIKEMTNIHLKVLSNCLNNATAIVRQEEVTGVQEVQDAMLSP